MVSATIPVNNIGMLVVALYRLVASADMCIYLNWMVLELAGLVLAGNSKSGSGRNRPK